MSAAATLLFSLLAVASDAALREALHPLTPALPDLGLITVLWFAHAEGWRNTALAVASVVGVRVLAGGGPILTLGAPLVAGAALLGIARLRLNLRPLRYRVLWAALTAATVQSVAAVLRGWVTVSPLEVWLRVLLGSSLSALILLPILDALQLTRTRELRSH